MCVCVCVCACVCVLVCVCVCVRVRDMLGLQPVGLFKDACISSAIEVEAAWSLCSVARLIPTVLQREIPDQFMLFICAGSSGLVMDRVGRGSGCLAHGATR